MQCISKTYYQIFQVSSTVPNLSPVQSTRLNSTQLSRVSFSRNPVFFWPHDVNTNTNIGLRQILLLPVPGNAHSRL